MGRIGKDETIHQHSPPTKEEVEVEEEEEVEVEEEEDDYEPPPADYQPQPAPPVNNNPPPQQETHHQFNLQQHPNVSTQPQPQPIFHPPPPVVFYIPTPIPQPNYEQPSWKTDLFDCMNNPQNAIITLFCPCVTFGQIAEIVDSGTTSCWSSAMRYCMIAICIGVPCIISCTYRSKLRSKYGLPESPASDLAVHCFCEYCALKNAPDYSGFAAYG